MNWNKQSGQGLGNCRGAVDRFKAFSIWVAILATLAIPTFGQDYLMVNAQGSLPQIALSTDPTPAVSLSILTSWNLSGNRGKVDVCVLMNSPMVGTGNNLDTISPASVQVNNISIVASGTNCGVMNARVISSNSLWKHNTSPATRMQSGYTTDTVSVRIAGYPASLEPDVYTGTITLIAEAQY